MLSKSEILKIIAEITGTNHKVVGNIFQAYTDLLKNELKKEGAIRLPNIGKFKVSLSQERIARNPQTGEQTKILPRARLKFAPIKDIKDTLGKLKWEYEKEEEN
ncbi:HU family DNA-binding protein [Mycoplasmoides alvi]|uniref:HU family DNA-binding protein n=1 Tax=Mycoplasmoides alvi TaxID=78580 RepID=UPI000698D779|nr:HU family DNA-binding protein [Mycoplasmoides alvi]